MTERESYLISAVREMHPEWNAQTCEEAARQAGLLLSGAAPARESIMFPVARGVPGGSWLTEPVDGLYMWRRGALEEIRKARALASQRDGIREMGIDIETYSDISIDCGVHRYTESPRFRVLLFAYSINGEPATCIDLESGETIPDKVTAALYDPAVIKTAWNAQFERVCLSKWFGDPIPPEQWDCSMIRAAMAGLPMSLDQAGKAVGLAEDEGKMRIGRALIRRFCVPAVSRSKASLGQKYRILPSQYAGEWEVFKTYCTRDVDTEQRIRAKVMEAVPSMTRMDRALYNLDQCISDLGIPVDLDLVRAAADLRDRHQGELRARAKEVSGLDNPGSVAQLKKWTGAKTLNKDTMESVLASATDEQREVLEIRRELGKTPLAKYDVLLAATGEDGRIRGQLQFWGTATGRWAGRGLQIHNLPQTHISDLDTARGLVRAGDLEGLKLLYSESISDILSSLVRTTLTASPRRRLIVCDYSAIEARVTAWLAGERWRLEAFAAGKDIYCESASRMCGVPVVKNGENGHLRKNGKIAELALGYQGGTGAMERFGAGKIMSQEEMAKTVNDWRAASPMIVRMWYDFENAARRAITDHGAHTTHKVTFRWSEALGGTLQAVLPSGRTMCYPFAAVDGGKITYRRVSQETHTWGSAETYGGKLTENIVQAVARDILGVALLRLDKAGYDILFHVHDEVIIDGRPGQNLDEVTGFFRRPPSWAEGLPLNGAGFTSDYYLKD